MRSGENVKELVHLETMKAHRDPVIEVYMRDVGRTLLRGNLKLTYEQRALKHQQALQMVRELQRAGKTMRHTR